MMLSVIENFDKLLTVMQNYTVNCGVSYYYYSVTSTSLSCTVSEILM